MIRTSLKLTMDQMAEKLGVNKYTYRSYERGIAEPNISLLIKLSETFDVSIDNLVKHTLEARYVPKEPQIKAPPDDIKYTRKE